jgi:hypothetical protein
MDGVLLLNRVLYLLHYALSIFMVLPSGQVPSNAYFLEIYQQKLSKIAKMAFREIELTKIIAKDMF